MRAILLLWLLCQPALGWSQQPPPAPPKTVQQPEAHAAKGEKAPTRDQQPAETPPAVLVRPASTHQPEAPVESEERRDYASSEWWLVYLTGALCAITGGLAFFTLRLWTATKDLSREAKATADRQAGEVRESLDIGRRTVTAMERNAERELQAYISVKLSDFPVPARWATETITVALEIYNAGQTPAYKVAPAIAMRTFPPSLDPQTLFPLDLGTLEGSRKKQMIGPKSGIDSISEMDRPLSAAQIKSIRDGTALFYLYGTVFYEDVFEKPHTTDFCWTMVVEGEKVVGLATEHGNDAD